MTPLTQDDRGISALWVAVTAVFLVASAALAVDTSGAFSVARTDQNTADLSCLAGVHELPDDPTAGINLAVTYAVDNWPQMAGYTTSFSGTTATYADGAGNEIYVDAAYGGDTSKMYVRITEIGEAYFSKVIGASNIPVTQVAWCRVNEETSGAGDLPFGAMPGGFQGGMYGPNPCSTGNCGSIRLARDDVSGQGPTLIKNIAEGTDRDLEELLGNGAGAVHCDVAGANGMCHKTDTDPGVSAAHLGEGFMQRLEDDPGATCTFVYSGRNLNCDTPSDVLGSAPTPLMTAFPSQPSFWEPSLHGTYNAGNTTNHYYFNGVIAKCDSPRLARMPMVTTNLNWDIGDPVTIWPGGTSEEVKFIDFLWVVIVEPINPSDFQGSGNLKEASSVIIWWGPDVECLGSGGTTYPFDPDNPGFTIKNVFLVDDVN